MNTAAAIPGDARHAVLDALGKILRRNLALDEALHVNGLEERDRGFARLLLATTLRRLGQIDALIAHCLEHPLPVKAVTVQDILRLGTAQLLFLDVAAHAAVDTAVRLAKDAGQTAHVKLVNAVLRRLGREGPALSAAQDAARLNTPAWLWESWTAAYGEPSCRAIAIAHLTEAPLDISVSRDPESWAERLDAAILPTGTLRRPAGGAIAHLPGYDEGDWWVQDAAAALPARLLGDVRGKRIADLCAAPGGKTAQLAAAGAHVTALDRSAKRLERLQANLARLRLAADVETTDATSWRPDTPVDGVLLDAPCSATGTLRRHPDASWLKRPEDVAKLTATQSRLLAAAVEMVAPGGLIVYCTCSLQPEEGIDQVEALLAGGAPLRRRPITPSEVGGLVELITPAGDLRSLPCHLGEKGGMDGFFAARLERL
ncbi:RsmB/NOP family class I SAM-dependent RNA methyltransferase [Telmatospirillum siberiense]|uniref:MFS transporter n=1 Tax=Telmatospirillum siberiense TaxID=382514 RepID=A0A2N3PT29_9PROT|nr:transcription antitermination factor NusB [Telmatospirillum siberiense]PKU23526.1 MFS transporter [Telmatospirillum siberiense]